MYCVRCWFPDKNKNSTAIAFGFFTESFNLMEGVFSGLSNIGRNGFL